MLSTPELGGSAQPRRKQPTTKSHHHGFLLRNRVSNMSCLWVCFLPISFPDGLSTASCVCFPNWINYSIESVEDIVGSLEWQMTCLWCTVHSSTLVITVLQFQIVTECSESMMALDPFELDHSHTSQCYLVNLTFNLWGFMWRVNRLWSIKLNSSPISFF